jgi:hypothetical protein
MSARFYLMRRAPGVSGGRKMKKEVVVAGESQEKVALEDFDVRRRANDCYNASTAYCVVVLGLLTRRRRFALWPTFLAEHLKEELCAPTRRSQGSSFSQQENPVCTRARPRSVTAWSAAFIGRRA